MAFKVGDRVQWTSQAGGNHKTKVGVVLAVVAPGHRSSEKACEFIHKLTRTGTHRSAYGGGFDRDHESYVVEVVVGGPRAKKALYWPVVSKLQPAG